MSGKMSRSSSTRPRSPGVSSRRNKGLLLELIASVYCFKLTTFYLLLLSLLYSPHEVYTFLQSPDLTSVLEKKFHKRHMESDAIESPFDTPEEIFLLEYLIASGYLIALYRDSEKSDSESYLISTMGHAFIRNYKHSIRFRLRAWLHYTKILYWILFSSTLGSLVATYIMSFF